MSSSIGVASRNLALDAALDVLNNGYLRIYSGTPPATADAALSGNTLLAELRFGSPAFGAASGGSKTANAITPAQLAAGTGTATFFRALKSDGSTVVDQDSVGLASAALILDKIAINAGDQVRVNSLVVTAPA